MALDNTPSLPLEAYCESIALDQPFLPAPPARIGELQPLIEALTKHLLDERSEGDDALEAMEAAGIRPRGRLQVLLTVRQPRPPLPAEILTMLDRLLQRERTRRRETAPTALPSVADAFPGTRYPDANRVTLWLGDITTLAADAIVNAANDELLGCFNPFHACIDNAIHSQAGPRLRSDCGVIMELQKHHEPVGSSKITRAYNLPSRFVLHTVGPTCSAGTETPSAEATELLAGCYRGCLDLAAQLPSIRTIAFCCISTGVFGFPREPACDIALKTVAQWMERHPRRFDRIIFNVFSEADLARYAARLG